MPELPDVEVFRRYFDATSLNQVIDGLWGETAILEGVRQPQLRENLEGAFFSRTRRHGKYLFAGLGHAGPWLVFHFGMTGFFKHLSPGGEKPPHTRFLLTFKNGWHLAWDCRRKLGRIRLTPDVDGFCKEMHLGIDALACDLTIEVFGHRLSGAHGFVKSTLMNQSIIAGIGNVYADEILYHAGMHPRWKVSELSAGAVEKLYESMRYVLETAIAAGCRPEKMPAEFLLSRRYPDAVCACGGVVEKITVSGRNGYYCPNCQK